MTAAAIEAEARRRWDERECGFPAFTRIKWEDGSKETRDVLWAEVAEQMMERTPDGSHRCFCGAWAHFGFGVIKDQLGIWYCGKHRHLGELVAAQSVAESTAGRSGQAQGALL